MPDDAVSNPLDSLQDALATGDMGKVRAALLALDQGELAALARRLGEDETQQLFRSVRNRRRGAARGRVIVIHGVMGGQLDSVTQSDAERVWLNYCRLFDGRISDFRLNDDGTASNPTYTIRVKGMFPEYLPLLNELAEQWDVLPFAFDWRLNIDDSARQLAKQVEDWGKGEPVHIVAHSMGGLVARRFIQHFPALWKSMQDGANTGKGGRLVMLGTPNKGSYAAPLLLSGAESTVKKLAWLDHRHSMSELLGIINTFPGSYQMMPSPDVNADDDHELLYDIRTWHGLPIVDQHLQTGRAFQQALTTVTDPDRLLYVAGYDQETPCRIKVGANGQFTYQTTMDGDGRVPHLFGLLEGVRTFYVREVHGDIPRNKLVLAAIHELLIDGTTGVLEVQLPATRSDKRDLSEWKRPDSDRRTASRSEGSKPASKRSEDGKPAWKRPEGGRSDAPRFEGRNDAPRFEGRGDAPRFEGNRGDAGRFENRGAPRPDNRFDNRSENRFDNRGGDSRPAPAGRGGFADRGPARPAGKPSGFSNAGRNDNASAPRSTGDRFSDRGHAERSAMRGGEFAPRRNEGGGDRPMARRQPR